MRFAVSNIAWSRAERLAAYARLGAAGITGLEIAPGLLFGDGEDPFAPSAAAMAATRAELAAAGLRLVSMQSLLFGVAGADLFGDAAGREAFATGIGRALALAARLQIPNLVLGSPAQRQRPPGMGLETAMDAAAELLRPLADRAWEAGTQIAIECTPVAYGTNFLVTPAETLQFVQQAQHPAIRLNFDVGALLMTETFNQVEALLETAGSLISHVHLSEPFLAPAPADPATAIRVLKRLRAMGYARAVSIEMRRPQAGLVGLDRALQHLQVARDAVARLP